MSYDPTDSLKDVVKERAKEIKEMEKGYIATINIIAEEIYGSARGKHTRIEEIFPVAWMILIPWEEILKIIFDLLPFLQAGLKKTMKKKEKMEAISEMISPWVSEVFLRT